MRLGIDVMGSDKGSAVFIEAIKTANQLFPDIDFMVFGGESDVSALREIRGMELVVTSEVIQMTDGLLSMRRKKDASMNRMLDALAAGKIDGCLSAGSTAGLLSCSLAKIELLPKVLRPCLIAGLPGYKGKPFYFLDMGANSDCQPEHLAQFALMGKYYAEICGCKTPRVALLNIGSEPGKGDPLHKEAYGLLEAEKRIQFTGNIEGRDLFSGKADVVVTDGMCGNMTIKAMEGTAYYAMHLLKDAVHESLLRKLGALFLKKAIYNIKDNMDYAHYGGAYLIGFSRPIVKAHGSSNEAAVISAIQQLSRIVKSDITESLRKDIL